jgi:ADP-heptose:LPS heptosyltransferase
MVRNKQLRLLVTRVDRIGDVVLSTPIPREVKSAKPNSFVAVLVRQETKSIYLNNPNVDAILTIDDEKGNIKPFWQMVGEIRKYNFSHAFMLLPQERLNWILFSSGISYRLGVSRKLYQFLTYTKFVSRRNYNPLRHEADYCLDMVRRIGIEPKSIHPEIFLSIDEEIKKEEIRKRFGGDGKILVGVNTTSGKSAPNITVSEYRKLIDLLLADKKFVVIVTDSNPPEELKNIKGIEYINNGRPLREAIVNFSALDVLISASTGPTHICAALKVKTLSLFCPLTACSPKLWGPLGNQSEVILPKENYCSNVCPGDPHICDFSGDGGIDSQIIYGGLKQFMLNMTAN